MDGGTFILNNILICRVVDFESSDDVANAIRKLDGTELKGKKVRLSEDPVHFDFPYFDLISTRMRL